uniref:Ig-like domain-containing protein n=1 Tax=Anabas testudineus TaxID=64144 RepID=A0AAQ6IRT7_ANATE
MHNFVVIFLFLLVLDAVLTVDPNWSSFFTGESVTFICDMKEGNDTDWKYRWNIDGGRIVWYTLHKRYTLQGLYTGDSGRYQCIGFHKRSNDTKTSNSISLTVLGESSMPTVTLDPNWSLIYTEMITVRCEIQGGDTEWEYEWETTSSIKPSNQNEFRISSASSSHSGNYRCKGRKKNAQYKTTEWSDFIKLPVNNSKSSFMSFKLKILFLCSFLFIFIFQLFVCDQHVKSMSAK